MTRWEKTLASGAAWGPSAFIGGWVAGGRLTPDYSAVDQAISQLAAVGADTRGIMNSGLVLYGVGVSMAAIGLRDVLGRPSALALTVNGLSTFGVLATPLGRSEAVDQLHAGFAGLAYAALAVTALLAARQFGRDNQKGLAQLSVAVGTATAASLLAILSGTRTGLFQRVGLTVSDLWLIGLGFAVLAGRLVAADQEVPTTAR